MLYIYNAIDIFIYVIINKINIIIIIINIIIFNMTQHNSFSLFFQPSQSYCWKFTCTYIICIVLMYWFIICSSCSSFIAIRNRKLYTNIIATPIDVHDILEIIYYAFIYITVLNPLAFGRCTLVSIHSSSDNGSK